MGIIDIAAAIGLGTFLGIVVIGLIWIYDGPRRRLKRATKKFKEENEELNRPSMRPLF